MRVSFGQQTATVVDLFMHLDCLAWKALTRTAPGQEGEAGTLRLRFTPSAGRDKSVTSFLNVVAVAFFSRARILGECLRIDSPPAFFFFFKWRIARAH